MHFLVCSVFTPKENWLEIEIMRLSESFTVFGFSLLSTGYNCQVNIDECASNPCLNQGTCFDDISGYTCHCVLPYTGGSWKYQQGPEGILGLALSVPESECPGLWGCSAAPRAHSSVVLPALTDWILSFEETLWPPKMQVVDSHLPTLYLSI